MKREFNPKKATPAILAACKMPELQHASNDEPFDIAKSAVVDWLAQQPDVRRAMFGYYKDRGAIVYNAETGTWKGRDS